MFKNRLKILLKIAMSNNTQLWQEVIDEANSEELGEIGAKIEQSSQQLSVDYSKIKEGVDSLQNIDEKNKETLKNILTTQNFAQSSFSNNQMISKRAGFFSSLFGIVGKGISVIFNPVIWAIYTIFDIYNNIDQIINIKEELRREFSDIIDADSFYFNPDLIKNLISTNSEDPVKMKKIAKLNNICKKFNEEVIYLIINCVFEIQNIIEAFILYDTLGLSSVVKSILSKCFHVIGLAMLAGGITGLEHKAIEKILEGFEQNKQQIISIAKQKMSQESNQPLASQPNEEEEEEEEEEDIEIE
jgi:tetrahydromethanopterin S-methyltransferase subunit B